MLLTSEFFKEPEHQLNRDDSEGLTDIPRSFFQNTHDRLRATRHIIVDILGSSQPYFCEEDQACNSIIQGHFTVRLRNSQRINQPILQYATLLDYMVA